MSGDFSNAGASPADFADVPPTGTGCTGNCGCTGITRYEQNDGATTPDIIQLGADGQTELSYRNWPWKATIQVDHDNEQINVTTNVNAINSTSESYGGGGAVAIGDQEFVGRLAKVEQAIKGWWNAKPYQIKIKYKQSENCGEKTYKVRFNPKFFHNGAGMTGPQHYKIKFYNDRSSNRGSYVSSPRKSGEWNWGSFPNNPVTGTDAGSQLNPVSSQSDTLEAHEFGHMIGIRDLYPATQSSGDKINGAKFIFNGDGSGRVELHNHKGILGDGSPDAGPHFIPLKSGVNAHACLMGFGYVLGVFPSGYMIPLGHSLKKKLSLKIDSLEVM